jgi:hypothetical protein
MVVGACVVLAAAGCASRSDGALGGEGSGHGLVKVGDVPDLARGEADAEVLTCDVVDEVVQLRAVVTNNSSGPQILQGVPYEIQIGGKVLDTEDSEMWNSATIGPGRQTLVETTWDLEGLSGEPECEVGEPDLRPEPYPGGEGLSEEAVSLGGCDDGDVVRVDNPADDQVGVMVMVEFFDSSGYSAGTMELGQFPTTFTDGTSPGPDEVALPAGETGEYTVAIGDRVTEWGTPLDGPISGCEVVSATYVVDPEPTEVIVD